LRVEDEPLYCATRGGIDVECWRIAREADDEFSGADRRKRRSLSSHDTAGCGSDQRPGLAQGLRLRAIPITRGDPDRGRADRRNRDLDELAPHVDGLRLTSNDQRCHGDASTRRTKMFEKLASGDEPWHAIRQCQQKST
jgi:hypothetical protein